MITSAGGGLVGIVNINENLDPATILVAADPDVPAGDVITYSIESTAGTDFAQFTIDPLTGAIQFVPGAGNYETPTDIGADNVYEIVVRATDTTSPTPLFDEQVLTITVVDTNDQPFFKDPDNLALVLDPAITKDMTVNENISSPVTFQGSDDDLPPQNLTFNIVLTSTDADDFKINPTTDNFPSCVSVAPITNNPPTPISIIFMKLMWKFLTMSAD